MKNIVVIGGGTGTYTALSGLKKYTPNLTAIVTMADDGGSSGELRDELGVLPPGDIRQCLIALSKSSKTMRRLLGYRFESGKLRGHSFGNIFLSALEKVTGSFSKALDEAGQILNISGKIIPVTLQKTELCAELKSGKKICGESNIQKANFTGNLREIKLNPEANINPDAVKAIKKASLIVIGPGNFYASLLPNLLVKGMKEAIRQSRAKKVFVCNLMTKKGHTDNFTVSDFVGVLENYLGEKNLDFVVFNTKILRGDLVERYARAGEYFVDFNLKNLEKKSITPIPAKLINEKIVRAEGDRQSRITDKITRTLIRHDSDRLARVLLAISELDDVLKYIK